MTGSEFVCFATIVTLPLGTLITAIITGLFLGWSSKINYKKRLINFLKLSFLIAIPLTILNVFLYISNCNPDIKPDIMKFVTGVLTIFAITSSVTYLSLYAGSALKSLKKANN